VYYASEHPTRQLLSCAFTDCSFSQSHRAQNGPRTLASTPCSPLIMLPSLSILLSRPSTQGKNSGRIRHDMKNARRWQIWFARQKLISSSMLRYEILLTD
jgi:hypothetical protein